MTTIHHNFTTARKMLISSFRRAPQVHPQRWQGVDVSKRPEAKMIELLHESFRVPLRSTDLDEYRADIKPNLPWADKHFDERVCGYPINPGVEWANWPWGQSAADHLEAGQFNHNYMERYWPKHAGLVDEPTKGVADWVHAEKVDPTTGCETDAPHRGIRYEYGDLNDLVDHLAQEPDTRQAYLPIFFPEDTGTMNPTRKPCTLGYHFILRHGYFHVTYYMRSCDFYRHWADDCYLTIRLHLWILDQLRKRDPDTWGDVKLGFFVMHITSLHMFTNDMRLVT
jgi:hypothetical protein